MGHALRLALRNFYNIDIYLTQNWYENGMAAVAVAAIIITDLTTIPIGNVGFNVSGGEWADGAKKAYTQNEILKRITTTKSVYNQKHIDSQTCIWTNVAEQISLSCTAINECFSSFRSFRFSILSMYLFIRPR